MNLLYQQTCIVHLPNIKYYPRQQGFNINIIYFKNDTNLMGMVGIIINAYNPIL